MPTKRLPWFKVWVGATRHEKVATLSDTDFRTWVELLDAASQQNVRGKFDSVAGAAAVTRRPTVSIKRLVTAGLLDDRQAEGLWMHDWKEWQRWRPEDQANDSESPPEPPSINTRSTHDHPPNVNGSTHDPPLIRTESTHDQHSKRPSLPRADAGARIDVEGEGDIDEDEDVNPQSATPPSPSDSAAAAKTTKLATFTIDEQERIDAVTTVLEPFGISHEPKLWRKTLDTYGSIDLEAEALKQADWLRRHRIRACSNSRYLEWLSRARNDTRANITHLRRDPTESEFVVEQVAATGECPYCAWHASHGFSPDSRCVEHEPTETHSQEAAA